MRAARWPTPCSLWLLNPFLSQEYSPIDSIRRAVYSVNHARRGVGRLSFVRPEVEDFQREVFRAIRARIRNDWIEQDGTVKRGFTLRCDPLPNRSDDRVYPLRYIAAYIREKEIDNPTRFDVTRALFGHINRCRVKPPNPKQGKALPYTPFCTEREKASGTAEIYDR